ncbi:MAG: hypothetical protein ACTSVU_07810 [Promethearchaeota archaeon]
MVNGQSSDLLTEFNKRLQNIECFSEVLDFLWEEAIPTTLEDEDKISLFFKNSQKVLNGFIKHGL